MTYEANMPLVLTNNVYGKWEKEYWEYFIIKINLN